MLGIILKKYGREILIGILLITNCITISLIMFRKSDIEYIEPVRIEKEPISSDTIYVDVKGAVNKPGVYQLNNDSIVQDAINMAGGLNKNGVTSNLNLSRKLNNQMVIKIFTKKELTKKNTISIVSTPCVCDSVNITHCVNESSVISVEPLEIKEGESNSNLNNEETKINEESSSTINNDNNLIIEEKKLISINTGTKEELMTLSGIGEAKANAIIEYRTYNNGFKELSDITLVSGISDNIYNKIKENIKL